MDLYLFLYFYLLMLHIVSFWRGKAQKVARSYYCGGYVTSFYLFSHSSFIEHRKGKTIEEAKSSKSEIVENEIFIYMFFTLDEEREEESDT